MNSVTYLAISSMAISLGYLLYRVLFRRDSNFRHMRYYLLATIIFASLLPFNRFSLNTSLVESESATRFESTPQVKVYEEFAAILPELTIEEPVKPSKERFYNWSVIKPLLWKLYLTIALFLLFRIIIKIGTLLYLRWQSEKTIYKNLIILKSNKIKTTFSFFRWVYINPENVEQENFNNILLHESIHAHQYHSLDLLVIELFAAAMWFNPFIWLLRNELQLVHEYLADEGTLNYGTDVVRYKALLINQAAGTTLFMGLSSGFNHSLIKKRFIMMSQRKFFSHSNLKLWVLVPFTVVLFLGVSCIKGRNSETTVTAVEPVKMNVLYLGADNPIRIAASGYSNTDLEVTIDNGQIVGEKGNYIVRPAKQGSAAIKVTSNGKLIQETQFRVKRVPDPVAKVARKKGGEITKDELLNQTEVIADMENFDFDLYFVVTSFTISTVRHGFTMEQSSSSGKITDEQRELIRGSSKGNTIYFQDIICIGPDSTKRMLNTLAFKLK